MLVKRDVSIFFQTQTLEPQQLLRFGEIRSLRSSFTVWRALRDALYTTIYCQPIRVQCAGHVTLLSANQIREMACHHHHRHHQ